MSWYIVKKNWDNIKETSLKHFNYQYIGLGGDIWPLDDTPNGQAQKIHNEFEKSREYVGINDGSEIYVCLKKDIAIRYYNISKKLNLDIVLIEIENHERKLDVNWCGFDFGNPTGGYSVIESELLTKNRSDLIKKYLNKFSLFDSLKDIYEFIDQIEDKTDVEYCFPYRIKEIKL